MNQESVGLGLGFRVPGKVPKIVQVVSRVWSAADGSQADALYRRPASLMSLLFRMHAPASRACRSLLLGQRSLQRFDVYNRADHGAASQVAAPHCAPAKHQLVSLAPAIILGPESAAGPGSRKIGLVGAAHSCELTLYWCWPDQKTALDPENDEGRPPAATSASCRHGRYWRHRCVCQQLSLPPGPQASRLRGVSRLRHRPCNRGTPRRGRGRSV